MSRPQRDGAAAERRATYVVTVSRGYGALGKETVKETTLSPLLGYSFDSRDSRIRPARGQTFSASIRASRSSEAT